MTLPVTSGTDVRRSPAKLAMPLLVVAVAATMLRERTTNVSLWTDFAHGLQYSLVLAGPLAAAAGAWIGMRERRHGLSEVATSGARSALARQVSSYIAGAAWLLLGFVAAAVVFGVLTATGANWGAPDVLLALSTIASLLAFLALGQLAGALFSQVITAPVVALAAYLVQVQVSLHDAWFTRLVPVNDDPISVASGYDSNLAIAQLVWFLLLVAASGAAFALIREKHRAAHRFLTVVLLVAPVLGLGLVSVTARSDDAASADQSFTCAGPAGATVCVHPAFAAILPELSRVLGAVGAPLAGLPSSPRRYEQTFTEPGFADGIVQFNLARVNNRVDPEFVAGQVAHELVMGSCTALNVSGTGPATAEVRTQFVVATWLLRSAGLPAMGALTSEDELALRRFSALDADRRQRWLKRHYGDLRACQVPVDELP